MTHENMDFIQAPEAIDLFDQEAISEALDIFESRYGLVVSDFFEDARSYIDTIADGINQGHLDTVIKAAHPLKSAAGTMGATSLYESARAIELNARKLQQEGGDMQMLVELMPVLEQSLQAAHKKFDAIVKSI